MLVFNVLHHQPLKVSYKSTEQSSEMLNVTEKGHRIIENVPYPTNHQLPELSTDNYLESCIFTLRLMN